MARYRKIDITLTSYTVRAIDRDGNIGNYTECVIGKYSEKEILKIFDIRHSKFIFKEIVNIEYIKNHYEVELSELYYFCEDAK